MPEIPSHAGHGEVPGERPEPPQSHAQGVTGLSLPTAAPQAPTDAHSAALRERLAKALFDFIVATPNATEYDLADAVLAVRDDELAQLRARVADYENAITWNTTCHGCAATLDASYAETRRAEQAEAAIARVRALAERWKHVADRKAGPRQELLAALEQTGGSDE